MFKLSYGYLISGIATGLILVATFILTLPDGKLHLVFCNVGQGDAAYVRFPDGRDMLIDGGPDNSVINCLGRYMPFWDREINLLVMSHPQKDHLAGLITVLKRFKVDYFVKSDVDNPTAIVKELNKILSEKRVPIKLVTAGEKISVGATSLSIIWPSENQIAEGKNLIGTLNSQGGSLVLGSSTDEMNDFSVVLSLHYGTFDVLFPGDADNHINKNFIGQKLANDDLEVLKVPHHGSKTGMTEKLVKWLRPLLAVISVGKNNYGHPAPEALKLLADVHSRLLRTDQNGDIEIVSDGRSWTVRTTKP